VFHVPSRVFASACAKKGLAEKSEMMAAQIAAKIIRLSTLRRDSEIFIDEVLSQ
jgi:hypothetical protein